MKRPKYENNFLYIFVYILKVWKRGLGTNTKVMVKGKKYPGWVEEKRDIYVYLFYIWSINGRESKEHNCHIIPSR
jgi:hypothetical protein